MDRIDGFLGELPRKRTDSASSQKSIGERILLETDFRFRSNSDLETGASDDFPDDDRSLAASTASLDAVESMGRENG